MIVNWVTGVILLLVLALIPALFHELGHYLLIKYYGWDFKFIFKLSAGGLVGFDTLGREYDEPENDFKVRMGGLLSLLPLLFYAILWGWMAFFFVYVYVAYSFVEIFGPEHVYRGRSPYSFTAIFSLAALPLGFFIHDQISIYGPIGSALTLGLMTLALSGSYFHTIMKEIKKDGILQ